MIFLKQNKFLYMRKRISSSEVIRFCIKVHRKIKHLMKIAKSCFDYIFLLDKHKMAKIFNFAAPYWYLFFYTCISYVGTYKIHHHTKIYYLQFRTLKCQIWFTYKFSMLSNITNTTYRAHQEYNCVNDDDHQYRRNGLLYKVE